MLTLRMNMIMHAKMTHLLETVN